MSELRRSIGGTVGTFIALSTILGSGMMILPGTSYFQLGRSAWIPWCIAAVSVAPLLYSYAWLGRRYPSASGVAHYSELALGRAAGKTAGLLAAFALTAGIPATAITGGRYVAEFSGWSTLAWLFPVMVLCLATVIVLAGTNVSGKVQVALVLGLFALVLATALIALVVHGTPQPSIKLPRWGPLGAVLTSVYVAFTGWETVAFTFEEHKRADLIPKIFATSYAAVVVLYALLLFGLFAVVDGSDPALNSAPLLILAEHSLGHIGRPIVLVLVIACITANVCASVLALSRLVFGLSRSGHLPRALSRVRAQDSNPIVSVGAVGVLLTIITLFGALDLIDFEMLFVLSGGMYFVLYGIGVVSFWKLSSGAAALTVSVISGLSVLLVSVLAGPPMWLSWLICALLWLVAVVSGRHRPHLSEPTVSPHADS